MMELVSFEKDSNEEVWDFVDKTVDIIVLHKFDPKQKFEWWNSSLRISKDLNLENVSVRNMEFDLQIPVADLKSILNLNIAYMDIYQFDRPIPATLNIESLSENSKEKILKENGLKHIIYIEFERVTIKSFNKEYIDGIKANPLLPNRIK